MKTKKTVSILDLRPRVRIDMNLSTRTIMSKRDKSRTRRALKKQLRDMV